MSEAADKRFEREFSDEAQRTRGREHWALARKLLHVPADERRRVVLSVRAPQRREPDLARSDLRERGPAEAVRVPQVRELRARGGFAAPEGRGGPGGRGE